MEQAIKDLKELVKTNRIQNIDVILGQKILKLLEVMRNNGKEIPTDMESFLFSLLTVNQRKISVINSHFIALCIVEYYKSLEKPSYWNLLQILKDEIEKLTLPSITIFGIVSKYLGDSFKSQLPPTVTFLMQINDDHLQPHICKFLRRVIKGSGSFLTTSIQDIFAFVFRGASSVNESLRIESGRKSVV